MALSTSPQATSISADEEQMWVSLEDGRTLGVPLAWIPRLLNGSPEDRAAVWISPSGLHWEELDEDIPIESLLAGRGDMTRTPRQAA